jgi:riboflavin synthase
MFTGLVTDVGEIASVRRAARGRTFTIRTSWDTDELELGESIAVDGACLTVTSLADDTFTIDASPETLSRTTLGDRQPGDGVHLERALRLADRLGGHLVLGHVDGVGRVVSRETQDNAILIGIEAPDSVAAYLIEKGSVTVDGVSLTVNSTIGNRFDVAIIPFTADETKLGEYRPGVRVNLEADVIGKYVRKFVSSDDSLADALERAGFVGGHDGSPQ